MIKPCFFSHFFCVKANVLFIIPPYFFLYLHFWCVTLYFYLYRGFKALKQTVKLYYKLGKYKEMMDAYREMLTYIKSAVTRNYSEKCINNIMDFVSGSASQNFSLLQEFYQTTLKALEEAKNEVRFVALYEKKIICWTVLYTFFLFAVQRLWFKTNLKLCKIWFDMGEYGRMSKVLGSLL